MPVGWLVTVPVPVPLLLTVRVWLPGGLKVAVTDWVVLMVTEQVPVPEQLLPLPARKGG